MTELATLFVLFGDMAWSDSLRIELWMMVYLILAVVSLFLAFNPAWLRRGTLLFLSVTGLIAALTHRMSIDCNVSINRLDTFNFLGCVGGYALSWLAVSASLLILILAFVNEKNKEAE